MTISDLYKSNARLLQVVTRGIGCKLRLRSVVACASLDRLKKGILSAFTCSYTSFRFLTEKKRKEKQFILACNSLTTWQQLRAHETLAGPYSFYLQIFNIVFIYILYDHEQGPFRCSCSWK